MKNEDKADTQAIQAVLSGDGDAFRGIVDRYTPVLFSLSHRMLGDVHLAEDAVQEIFLRVYRSLDRYDRNRRFFTWIFTISVNYLRSVLRSSRWRIKAKTVPFDESARLSFSLREETNPEEETIRNQAEQAVQAAVAMLPVKYREVFVLREIEGVSAGDAAVILGIPENTVKTNLRRARERLKKILISQDWNET